jgi:hypothetical protein
VVRTRVTTIGVLVMCRIVELVMLAVQVIGVMLMITEVIYDELFLISNDYCNVFANKDQCL